MKAAYANGVLTAFERAGFHDWAAVVGTSAGGALAAWYAAGQAEYAEGTWKYAADPRIMNYQRALTLQGPLLDHDRLWYDVYENEHPLDIDALRKAPWPVIVTVADVERAEVLYPDVRKQDDPGAWIRATGRLPFASGPSVEIHGRQYVDGGVLDPIPLRYAIDELNADHITLITNKQPGPQRKDPRLLVELAARRYPALRQGLIDHNALKQAAYKLAQDPPEGVTIDHIHPSRPTRLTRLSRDQAKVKDGLELGHRDGARYVERALAAVN